MKRRLIAFLLGAAALPALAQSIPAPGEISQGKPAPPPPAPTPPPSTSSKGHLTAAQTQALIDRLSRTNQDLLDLLKQQQSVLEDIQYDRRLQNRQINLIEQRLEDTLQLNATLQAKIAKLEAAAAAPAQPSGSSAPTAQNSPAAKPTEPVPPPPPASYLPTEQPDGAPGTMWWHRIVSLSGDDSENSKSFHISGKQWRVLWHNQDRPGDAYKNTSALFISAFPVNDTVPKKVCSQLGSAGDSTELTGTGDFYLKIEASGGHWELAVEDFR